MEMVGMIAEAYVRVYGLKKWECLTDEQKHDVVMTVTKDLLKEL